MKDISAFKREHELAPADGANGGSDFIEDDELDLRAEDDALVAAELDAEQEAEVVDDDAEEAEAEETEAAEEDGDGEEQPRRRRRGRRGGRGRRRGGRKPLEGTFDHGAEGYGLWLDPSIQDDPVYAEHWAGHRPVTVAVEPDRIVITRSGEDSGEDSEDE